MMLFTFIRAISHMNLPYYPGGLTEIYDATAHEY